MDAPKSQLEALLTTAAFAPIHNTGWIRVTGEDRVRWLNGMVTNSIQALKLGEGCYNFFLNAQGRIQGDAIAWLQDGFLLLETAADRIPALIAYLDRFIIMDDVELAPETHAGLLLTGPEATRLLVALDLKVPGSMDSSVNEWQSGRVHLAHIESPLLPHFELWSDPATLGLLIESLRHAGVAEATPQALEHLRLLEATPLYGTDIRDKELPQETGQTRALHFSKGCYLGQEIVERIRSRGQVNRLFQAFTLNGYLPLPGEVLSAGDPAKPVGELTSVAEVPGHGMLALGYVRREALDSKASLTYPGGIAIPRPVSSQTRAVS